MILARVKGNVVASVKHESYQGQSVLIVQPIDETGKDLGSSMLSVDSVSAAPGDVVLVQQLGASARQILKLENAPIHSVICGIVDQVTHPLGE
jgi:ethanolamine utilization protein EutN